MRRIGCSTWCCLDRPLPEAFGLIVELTDTVEIFADAAHDILDYGECLSPCRGISLSVHAPTADINLASTREPVRMASVALVSAVCERAGDLGASAVVVHPGISPWPGQEEVSRSALSRSLDDLARVQEEVGVRVAVENMGSWEMCHFRDTGLLPEIAGRGLSFCLDVGHAHLNNVLDRFLSLATPCIVHLHDNCGSTDDHLPPGRGSMDYPSLLGRLPAGVPWILEVPDIGMVEQGLAYVEMHTPFRRGGDRGQGDPPLPARGGRRAVPEGEDLWRR
ncbi:MAG: sugar phosphate isomerase/epimerase family protein [Methanolinea sp.]|nr:sugar phosphate isomerase/epimerase family protein [Methanolinea sp.]